MTKLLTIVLSCLFMSPFIKQENGYVITPGVGTGDLQVGKTKVTTAFNLLGKNDKYSMGIVDMIDTYAIHINRYIYEKKGLKIISNTYETKGEDLENAVVDVLEFEKPAVASTDNNIVLGKTKRDEITKAFGKPDDEMRNADVTLLVYWTKGITFLVDNQTDVPIKISVYEKNKRPYFD